MALELKQSLKLSQQLVMTPQLQQAIKLLQLNRMELAEHVMTEMLENPILEEGAESTDEEEELEAKEKKAEEIAPPSKDEGPKEVDPVKGEGTDDINWENYLNSQSYEPTTGGGFKDVDPDLPSFESTLTRLETLGEHLLWQLQISHWSQIDKSIGEMIIGNVDDDGYLRAPVEEIAQKQKCSAEEVARVLSRIQEFDPLGVAARDLKECLLIQSRQIPDNVLIRSILENHLKDLERKTYPAIARDCGVSVEEVIAAVKRISALEPKPGRRFYDESAQYITPDIYIYKSGNEFIIVQNEDGLPKLRISNFYQNMLRANTNGATHNGVTKEYVNEKMRSAVWLMRSIYQRQRTILKVTESIVKLQREFFEHGISRLRPMVLRDVAEDIGMHESTVSRVTSNKYVHTPQGIFELKFFFNSSIKRVEGSDVASEAVKEKIKNIIQGEDVKRPFSDQEIVELLRQVNIDIARRTVAKYREMLGILSSSKRKRFF